MKRYIFIIIALMHISMSSAHEGCPREREVFIDLLASEQQKNIVLDISRYQGEIDFEQLASSSQVRYIFAKATEGSNYIDPQFYRNVAAARDAGIKIGAYHFFTEKSSAKAQAIHFLNTIQQLDLDLIPVIDIELNFSSVSQLVDSLYVMVHCIEDAYQVKPMIYTSESFFKHFLQNHFEDYPLWVARYNKLAPSNLGTEYILWQFSEMGNISGIDHPVDVSQFVDNHRPCEIELSKKSLSDNKKSSSSRKKKLVKK